MPSLQQLRHEALAAEVERATRPLLVKVFGAGPQPLEVRIERVDGSILELKVKEVVLDGGGLVGTDARRQVVVIPLADVKAVWRRGVHIGRTAVVFAATMLAGAVAMVVGSSAPFEGAVGVGLILGMPVAGLVSVMLNQFKVLSEWVLLYDEGE